jgi:transglutaminase-like putative cysteine protease
MATRASKVSAPVVLPNRENAGDGEILFLPPAAPFGVPASVTVCSLRATHFTNYRYARAARHVVTQLRLVPPLRHGWQVRRMEQVHIAPLPHTMPRHVDTFGNTVVEVRHEQVEQHLTLVMEAEIETRCAYTAEGLSLPLGVALAPQERREDYLSFTRRTVPADGLELAARDFMAGAPDPTLEPLAFISALARFVHGEMTFMTGATGVGTTAGEAWEARRGVCQDYAHIMLSLCRLCGVPARYISGFVPGEGVMHAWTEALLTLPGGSPAWWAVDPTYNKWVNERYVTVAAGREYGDITPTSGTYFGGASELQYRTKVVITNEKTISLVP